MVLLELDLEAAFIVGADEEVVVVVSWVIELDCIDGEVLAVVAVREIVRPDDGRLFAVVVVVVVVDDVCGVVLISILDDIVELRKEVILKSELENAAELDDDVVRDNVLEEELEVLEEDVILNSVLETELDEVDVEVVLDSMLDEVEGDELKLVSRTLEVVLEDPEELRRDDEDAILTPRRTEPDSGVVVLLVVLFRNTTLELDEEVVINMLLELVLGVSVKLDEEETGIELVVLPLELGLFEDSIKSSVEMSKPETWLLILRRARLRTSNLGKRSAVQ